MTSGLRKLIPSLLLVSFLAVGCSGQGSQFVGKWVNTTNASDTMEITRNGEQFLIITPHQKLGIGAVYKDGFLQVPSTMGALTLTYIKSSDTLVAPGLLGQIEYKRVDHFESPSGQFTVHTPGGTVTTNTTGSYSASDLGTDIYPGAQSAPGGMRMDVPTGSMVSGVFLTSDSKDMVVSFYKGKLGADASVFDTADGAVLTLSKGQQESVVVTVTAKPSENDGKTKIAIMHTRSNVRTRAAPLGATGIRR